MLEVPRALRLPPARAVRPGPGWTGCAISSTALFDQELRDLVRLAERFFS